MSTTVFKDLSRCLSIKITVFSQDKKKLILHFIKKKWTSGIIFSKSSISEALHREIPTIKCS